jgi:ribosomal protein S18 acetylase RimI-like enzyme
MDIRTVRSTDGMLLKAATLRSVEDAPHAFGGPETLAEEGSRPDAHWHQLAAECAGEVAEWRGRCIAYFATDGEAVCGKAISFLGGKTSRTAYLSGVWVDPAFRRQGLGRRLVREACAWAASKGADALKLWVDDANPAGAAFYQSLGFQPTGESRPVSPRSADRQSCFGLALPAR